MAHALALDSEQMALDVLALLRELDPARLGRFEESALERLARELDRIRVQLSSILEKLEASAVRDSVAQSLARLQEVLDRAPDLQDVRLEWLNFRGELITAYQQVSLSLAEWDIHVPHLRPTNYSRNILHMSSGVATVLMVELVLNETWMVVVAAAWFLFAWQAEIGRRVWPAYNDLLMRNLKTFAHPHEWHRVNSSTWYCTALLALALTSPKVVCVAALMVLGFGDPLAAIVGRRWGRVKLVNGRSLEGTLAFFVTATLAAWAATQLFHPGPTWSYAAIIGVSAALPGAMAELFSRRIDDNLSIPIAAAVGVHIALGTLWL